MAIQQRKAPPTVRRRRPLLTRILAPISLARRRFAHNALLLASLGLGILAATVLLCTVPVFANTVSDIGLQQDLRASDVITRSLEVSVQLSAADAQTTSAAETEQAGLVRQYLSSFLGAGNRVLVSDPLLLQKAGGQPFDIGAALPVEARYLAYDYQSAGAHIHLEAGALPGQSAAPAALMTDEMATAYHLRVGDTLVMVPFGDHTRQLTLRISGIWKPNDPNDAYWFGRSFSSNQGANQPLLYPLLVSSDAYFAQLAGIPNLQTTAFWDYPIQPEQLHIAQLSAVLDNLSRFTAEATNRLATISGVRQAQVNTGLNQLLSDYQHKLDLLALPLYVVMAQVLGLILFYIVVVAGLLVERQAAEIATLKSRGASGLQVLGLYLAQGAILAVIAALLGPWLAVLLTRGLVFWLLPGTANLVSAGYLGAVTFPASIFWIAGLVALLCLGALALATLRAARLDVLAFRREQARAMRQPLWQRLYLDVGLAVLCAAGYVELNYFGGANVRGLLGGGAASDPILLVTPGLLLLAGALLALRFFPLLVRGAAHLATLGRGATNLLALIQIARSPLHYTRLVLLLTLAVGLGLFTLTFSASLSQSQADGAGYQAGADFRATESAPNATPAASDEQKTLAALPGVQAVSAARRTSVNTSDAAAASVGLLAIDPATFASVSDWRGDFATQSLNGLMASLRQHALQPGQLASVQPDNSPVIWAVVSQSFLDENKLAVGDLFVAVPSEATFAQVQFRVGAVVQDFPTMYDRAGHGYMVVDLNDYLGVVNGLSGNDLFGPSEFWLRSVDDGGTLGRLRAALTQPEMGFQQVFDRRALQAAAEQNPLQAGLRGVLLLGVLAAGGLAVLGSLIYSALTARQRATQFAVLRTLGASGGQLVRLLLGEQLVVYLFGLLAGTALGAVLATATLPYLAFNAGQSDAATQNVPPAVLTVQWPSVGLFYGCLVLALVLALLWMATYANRVGLGRTLRLGED
ncbi:MAG TPA: FtsX-like permease family protein [Ktedonobacterales bacterium]|nr:FtsX-like permease family protein [Ktedonobacterales bacterium]